MTSEEIKRIQRGLCSLAYIVDVDGVLGPETYRALMDFQRARGLAVNGDPNEATLAALWRAVPAEMPAAPGTPASLVDLLPPAGERAVTHALSLWQLDVYDPRVKDESQNGRRCKTIIADIIARAGWGWSLVDGKFYLGDGPPQWCGLFAADCWRAAGMNPSWMASFWASTLRMAKWFRYENWDDKSAGTKPAANGRMIIDVARGERTFPDGTEPRAGDIVIVGDGRPVEGDHITLLEGRDGATWRTISGNGGGRGPTGKNREGIVKTDYFSNRGGYRVLWCARPGLGDLLQVQL